MERTGGGQSVRDEGTGAGGDAELPPVITVDELAELLRVERKTAYAAVTRGEIPGVRRLGRCIRISRDAAMRWLGEGETRKRRGRRAA